MTLMTASRRRVAKWAMLGAIPVAGTLVAVLATRTPKAPASSPGHDHSQMVEGDAPQAIYLTSEAARRVGVTYAVAIEEQLSREVRVVGQISVDETRVRVIAPKIDGWVERLYADATGKEVEAGAPLMTVYTPMVSTAQEELFLAKRLVAETALSDSATRLHSASLLAAARSRLAAWDVSSADVARIEAGGRSERTVTITSPLSGFIIEKNVVEGQRIMAGDVLLRVVDLTSLWLEGEVYEQDLAVTQVGQAVSAELQALPGREFIGRVAFVSPTLNAESRTARIRVQLSNAGRLLKPGMVATIRLVGSRQGRVLTVPRAAVLSTGERNIVFVKRTDGMLEPRIVQTGAATDARITILAGLSRGDSVVASATFLVDAESNLGKALGGMGDMPGMDIVAPKKRD
jgi:Cu(I)/Ag(I) efflux system membrane fusion protein